MEFIDYIRSCVGRGILVGGHRGHKSEIRENTIDNFAQIEGRVAYIEVDVQLTMDKKAVLFHDKSLAVEDGIHGMICEHTLKDLKENIGVCTIDESMEWCVNHDMAMAIEIKSEHLSCEEDRELLAELIAKAVKAHDFYNKCFVFSIDLKILKKIKRIDSMINIGVIPLDKTIEPISFMKDMDAVVYLTYMDNLSKETVSCLHEAGYIVDGSVANSIEDVKRAVMLGVDLIESDEPEKIMEWLEENYDCKLSYPYEMV